MNIWEQSFEDLRRPHLEEKKGDGNLANNYPPYDKVTRGDIIAGATGKDQMGGKKKQKNVKEAKNGGVSKAGEGKFHKKLDTLVHDTFGKRPEEKKNTREHSDWRSDLGFFTEEDCGCDGPIKPKKGIKNKVTINPDLKTEENISENPLVGLGIKAGLAAGTALAGKMVYDKAKGVADKLQQRNQQTQKAIDSLKNSYEPEGEQLDEVTPPGAKYERMVKHIKKGYSDGGLSKKEKSIAYATAWKQYNKAKNEEFAGNYEGPLYAPHPDIDEAYKEIDKDKENRMYRRAGNLARTALSSTGKKKAEAQKKSSNIVSAITRQKEKERFDRIGQSPKHNEALENELDYYLGEALRPASERMKRTQTAAGRKKQEQEREKKSKLEAEADKILAGFSKKGTGTAKTKAAPKASAPEANRSLKTGQKKDTLAMKANKAMSEQEDRSRRGTDFRGRDYGGTPEDHEAQKRSAKAWANLQGGWSEKEKKKKETK